MLVRLIGRSRVPLLVFGVDLTFGKTLSVIKSEKIIKETRVLGQEDDMDLSNMQGRSQSWISIQFQKQYEISS